MIINTKNVYSVTRFAGSDNGYSILEVNYDCVVNKDASRIVALDLDFGGCEMYYEPAFLIDCGDGFPNSEKFDPME